MFAVVTFEREPLTAADVYVQLIRQIQDAGAYVAFGVLLWLLMGYLFLRPQQRQRIPGWLRLAFTISVVIGALDYAFVILAAARTLLYSRFTNQAAPPPSQLFLTIYYGCLTLAGLLLLTAAFLPFFRNLTAVRWRRIWALARLSFKEAVRRRVLYAFSFLLLVFLFASWFVPYKPEYQVRTYVAVFDWSTTWILLWVAVLLTSFSIPSDIRQQTIHTILTKPTERLEVLLGRILGFTGLMTLVLLVMTSLSLLFVLRSVDPAAAAESLKAREPLYGTLHFENTADQRQATNVGREWDYRSYISGPQPGQKPQTAVWDFARVPASLGNRSYVRCEFAFDIYRTTKGLENRGVPCELVFVTSGHGLEEDYSKARRQRLSSGAAPSMELENELSEQYGYYIVPAKEVTDYHTQTVDVPAGLFRNAARSSSPDAPPLQVRMTCKSLTQYIGVAKGDFYIRMDDPSGRWDRVWFAWNYYKGAFGLWLRLCLIITLAVTLSTYLSGVISLLVTLVIYIGGVFVEFIRTVATGQSLGGGPMESLLRIAGRQVAIVPLDETPTKKVAEGSDEVFRWLIRRVLDMLPDVDRFDLMQYVSEGFNIPGLQLLYLFLSLIIYLAPWILLGFYLLKWREVASAN